MNEIGVAAVASRGAVVDDLRGVLEDAGRLLLWNTRPVAERMAPAASRRADVLRGRLRMLADPPVYLLVVLAYYAARANHAEEARQLAERALACEPYPPPLDICPTLIIALTLVECHDALQRLCEDLVPAARRRGAVEELVAILVSARRLLAIAARWPARRQTPAGR